MAKPRRMAKNSLHGRSGEAKRSTSSVARPDQPKVNIPRRSQALTPLLLLHARHSQSFANMVTHLRLLGRMPPPERAI